MGWTPLGKLAGLLCILLMLIGYGMDLEQTTLRGRFSQSQADLTKVIKLCHRQRTARQRAVTERNYWRDRALGSRILVPDDKLDPLCVRERLN